MDFTWTKTLKLIKWLHCVPVPGEILWCQNKQIDHVFSCQVLLWGTQVFSKQVIIQFLKRYHHLLVKYELFRIAARIIEHIWSLGIPCVVLKKSWTAFKTFLIQINGTWNVPAILFWNGLLPLLQLNHSHTAPFLLFLKCSDHLLQFSLVFPVISVPSCSHAHIATCYREWRSLGKYLKLTCSVCTQKYNDDITLIKPTKFLNSNTVGCVWKLRQLTAVICAGNWFWMGLWGSIIV